MVNDLTDWAQQGYDADAGTEAHFTDGSNAFLAWKIGNWLRSNGSARPSEVMPDLGYALRVDGVRIVITGAGYGEPVIVTD